MVPFFTHRWVQYYPSLKINTRYNILNKDKKWIKPVDDSVIRYLYNCFQGDIRDIMNTLTNLMSRIPESFNNTLTLNDVKEKLKVIEFQKLKNQGLTEKELEVLKEILKLDKFTNASLGQVTTKSKQNINKYIRRFEDLKLIELLEKVGRNSYYTISPRLKLLKTLFK